MNLLEPWILFRLAAGLVACLLFARGAMTAQKVLRHFDVRRATEGQLALEKQVELGATFVRVGATVQVFALLMSVLGADRMSRGVRGAMCAYGVFGANEWGFRSLLVTSVVALAAGIVTQVYVFDARVRTLDLSRPLAFLTLAMFPLSVFDLASVAEFFGQLDLSVVASCCSVELDPGSAASQTYVSGPRAIATVLAILGTVGAVISAGLAIRSPTRFRIGVAACIGLLTLPGALAAVVLQVAPHVFEVPQHVCPFCLFRNDAYGIGYPLFGALFFAAVWGGGAGVSSLLAKASAARDALGPFASRLLRRAAYAWVLAFVIAVIPVARFALVAGGGSLFQGH